MPLRESWKRIVSKIKLELRALWYAYRDARTPWFARAWVALVIGYAFSPIDLIPDFIPGLGYLDDAILLPLGVTVALRLIPAEVMRDARERAAQPGQDKPVSVAGGVVIGLIWAAGLVLAGGAAYRFWQSWR